MSAETMPACIYCGADDHWSQACPNIDPEPLCGPLCGAQGSRDRVCALPHYHTGAHSFVPRTERED